MTCTSAPLSSIPSGSSLVAGQTLTSADGSRLQFVNGNLVLYDSNGVSIWNASTTGGQTLVNSPNGTISIMDANGKVLWSRKATQGSSIMIQGGQMVLTNGGSVSWGSSSGYTTVSNILNPGESLTIGESRISSNGEWEMTLLSNGNLIIKSTSTGQAIWSSNTTNSGATGVTMKNNGNLVLYGSSGNTIWSSSTNVAGSSAYISNTGKLIISYGKTVSYSTGGGAYECGTFIQYDAFNDQFAPTIDGFLAGTYGDGSDVYVGLGNNSICGGEPFAPCRLKTNDNAGCYIPSCGLERFDNQNSFYLLNDKNFKWIPVTRDTLKQSSPLIFDIPGVKTLAFGRINSTASGVDYTTVGKVIYNRTSSTLYINLMYWIDYATGTEKSASTYEVLSCVTCQSTLTSGQVLNIGDQLCAGDNTMTLQSDGNLVIRSSNGTILWSSNTANSGANRLVMKADGSLSLEDAFGKIFWTSAWYAAPVVGSSAMLSTDGSLVVFNGNTASWSSSMESCADSLWPGQVLNVDESRTSCGGSMKMTMQSNGDFVVSSSNGQVLWSTGTVGSGAVKAVQQQDGNFVLLNANNNIVWQSATYGSKLSGSAAKITDDGRFIIYSGSVVTFTGRSRPKGTQCGIIIVMIKA